MFVKVFQERCSEDEVQAAASQGSPTADSNLHHILAQRSGTDSQKSRVYVFPCRGLSPD